MSKSNTPSPVVYGSKNLDDQSVVYGNTPNPAGKPTLSHDGSVKLKPLDFFPEKAEDKQMIREVADWMKITVRDKKSGDLVDCVIFKSEGNSNKFFLIGFSKSRSEGARGPVGKVETPKQCGGKFTSMQDAQRALRLWIDNPASGVDLIDVERKYKTWTRS
jgi:hypothetical protein